MTRCRHLLAAGVLVAAACVCAAGQATDGWITGIRIDGLAPFEVSFRFVNPEPAPLQEISGQATLMDERGQAIERITIARFSAGAESSLTVRLGSRWDFQQLGVHLLEVALDVPGVGLVSDFLRFEILPVRLPLEPEPVSREAFTIHQEPVSWGLERISAQRAWEISHGSPGVVVAVIDSGIDWSVPQIAGSLWENPGEIAGNGIDDDGNGYIDDVHGWDFRDDDNGPSAGTPLHPHGTIVSSIIAAQPGELPIVGVAPGIRIMDVRFLDSSNSFRASDWGAFTDAVDYAVDNGARIINLSIYATGRPPRDFEVALERAASRGVIVVGIAGNQGQTEVMYPGKYGSVLAVSATTDGDLLATFSNRGTEVALCAPGQSITSLSMGGRATTQSGTSFAAPHVSGILALILSVAPYLSGRDAVSILEQTAVDLGSSGKDDLYGSGRVDAERAVLAARR